MQRIKDWIIDKLGGYTVDKWGEEKQEWQEAYDKLDISNMIRTQLEGIKLSDVLTNLDEKDKKEYIIEMARISDNKALRMLLNDLKVKQILFTVKQARTMDEVGFGRATINGISLIEEELNRAKALQEELQKKIDVFDEHAII